MDERIVLDEKSFKALAADSRISILKNLTDRRRTLTELSQKLNLGGSTVKEHCDILVRAELIKQIDEGRKWKYYELTPKGKQIAQPSFMQEVRALIILCFGTFVVGGIVFIALQSFTGAGNLYSSGAAQSAVPMVQDTTGGVLKTTIASETIRNAIMPTAPVIAGISAEAFAISVIISIMAGILIGWYFTRKR